MRKTKSCPYACHEGTWRSGGTAPVILNIAISLKWVVSLMVRPL